MAACRQVCDSRHLQADCQEPGSALEPYAWQSGNAISQELKSLRYTNLFIIIIIIIIIILGIQQ